jgi:protein gp37
MGQATSIEWTDATWNPVHGCSKVSPGCAHCYAETLSLRFGHTLRPWLPAHADVNVQLKPERLHQPLQWRYPRMVFVNSMSDLFHEKVPDSFIDSVFETMAQATRHTFQILTKRPDRMREYIYSSTWSEPLPKAFGSGFRLRIVAMWAELTYCETRQQLSVLSVQSRS